MMIVMVMSVVIGMGVMMIMGSVMMMSVMMSPPLLVAGDGGGGGARRLGRELVLGGVGRLIPGGGGYSRRVRLTVRVMTVSDDGEEGYTAPLVLRVYYRSRRRCRRRDGLILG